jgi:hypothetical protein
MNRDSFMEFFRNDEALNTLSNDDRHEIFASILSGSSDFKKNLIDLILSNYGGTNLVVFEKTESEQLLPIFQDIFGIADLCSTKITTILLGRLEDFAAYTYRDMVLKEHIYSLETIVEDDDFMETLLDPTKAELLSLKTALDKSGCAYIRIIFN